MKKILLLSFVFAAISLFAQTTAKVSFKETKHNFGKIKQGKPVTYIFKFKNTGAKPLIIESAVAGCGCTTPEYPKQPIAKDKEGTIKVTYNAANPGAFTKDVTIKFVGTETPVVLNVSGEVLPAAKAATPTPKKTANKILN